MRARWMRRLYDLCNPQVPPESSSAIAPLPPLSPPWLFDYEGDRTNWLREVFGHLHLKGNQHLTTPASLSAATTARSSPAAATAHSKQDPAASGSAPKRPRTSPPGVSSHSEETTHGASTHQRSRDSPPGGAAESKLNLCLDLFHALDRDCARPAFLLLLGPSLSPQELNVLIN